MNHPLRNFQRGPTWSSNNDPLVTSNRIMDDFQFLPGRGMKSIVDRDSGTIGILECCSITIETRRKGTDMPESNIWILRDHSNHRSCSRVTRVRSITSVGLNNDQILDIASDPRP